MVLSGVDVPRQSLQSVDPSSHASDRLCVIEGMLGELKTHATSVSSRRTLGSDETSYVL